MQETPNDSSRPEDAASTPDHETTVQKPVDEPAASDSPTTEASAEDLLDAAVGGQPGGEESSEGKPKILIGSQRDPGAYREVRSSDGQEQQGPKAGKKSASDSRFPPPNIRNRLSDDLEREFEDLMGEASMDDLMQATRDVSGQETLEPDSKQKGRVLTVRREDVFIELGGREQGVVPLKQFDEAPEQGAEIDVVVVRFDAGEGLYELRLPASAASVGDWSEIEEGMTVEARVTGHNTGGLEAEVNHIRGFIPVSQIALYRVENLEEFVGEKFICVVTEANPERRNLVLSRRALLEREREASREKLLQSLEEGAEFEGVVRKLMDFGAFVDIGDGVDGLIHISELSWSRLGHPSEVLSEGQKVTVRIKKYDPETGRIGLAYREMIANPWDDIQAKYAEGNTVKGRVVKIMEFGAFVELEPGVEGLVHISELAHRRVNRVNEVVGEGEEVEVMVLSVDPEQKRIGLSIKQLKGEPVPETPAATEPAEEAPAEPVAPKKTFKGPLKGGLGRDSGGEQFGLKW